MKVVVVVVVVVVVLVLLLLLLLVIIGKYASGGSTGDGQNIATKNADACKPSPLTPLSMLVVQSGFLRTLRRKHNASPLSFFGESSSRGAFNIESGGEGDMCGRLQYYVLLLSIALLNLDQTTRTIAMMFLTTLKVGERGICAEGCNILSFS